MSHRRLWIAATIIALVVLGGFILSVPHTRDIADTRREQATSSVLPVTVQDSFKKGVHTITGTVETANACAAVTTEATITPGTDASSTPAILVGLTMTNDEGVCLQLPTLVPFKTTVSTTTSRLPLIVTVNGVVATTTTP